MLYMYIKCEENLTSINCRKCLHNSNNDLISNAYSAKAYYFPIKFKQYFLRKRIFRIPKQRSVKFKLSTPSRQLS